MTDLFCPFCGHALSPADAYCDQCGQALPPSEMVGPEGVVITLDDAVLIGRDQGPCAERLKGFQFMSGRHALLSFEGGCWCLTDLDSRNGTTINGGLQANHTPIFRGDRVVFARSYEFVVR